MTTIEKIKDSVMLHLPKDKITKVYLFGSYAKGKATSKSDVDLHLFTKGKCTFTVLGTFISNLEKDLGVQIDIITNEIIPESEIQERRKQDILESEILLYG